jgi:hypothetical protein
VGGRMKQRVNGAGKNASGPGVGFLDALTCSRLTHFRPD